MTTTNQSGDADCGVEVVGKGEGNTLAALYAAAVDSRPGDASDSIAMDVLYKAYVRNGKNKLVRSNIRLTNRPITAAGLRLIAERLEV